MAQQALPQSAPVSAPAALPAESEPQIHAAVESPFRRTLRGVLMALLLWLAWGATAVFDPSPAQVNIVVGEAAPRNIKATYQVSYVSQVKTEEARQRAEAAVEDVYVGPDLELARAQIDLLGRVLAYIGGIRADPYGKRAEQIALLQGIPQLEIGSSTWETVLKLEPIGWETVSQESQRLLSIIMRDEIRPNQLTRARLDVQRLATHTLTPEEREVVSALVGNLIVPNTFFDADLTEQKRQEARASVTPVNRTIRAGEAVVREGEIVNDLAYEELQVMGLLADGTDWHQIGANLCFALLVVLVMSIYVLRVHPLLLWRPRRQLLLVMTLVALAVAARLLIPGHVLLPYLFPAAAGAMLIALFMDIQYATLVSIIAALTVGLSAGGSVELTVYILLGSLVGALALWHSEQLSAFIPATGYLAAVNVATLLLFRITNQSYDTLGLLQLAGMGLLNAVVSSSLCFVAYAFTGRIFGVTTSLQLMELARPDHPLFKQLLLKAPGTYHHSIIISNMAESAAEAIGADALLARVGSYYHDIGKIARPYFFSENQGDGENPHDKLDPLTSAEIVIGHTQDGLELAQRYHLPDKIRDFITEHHGTTLVTSFYRKASQSDDGQEVDEAHFRYPGPRPQSRETAIVMLADAVEAWSRASHPATEADMERLIRQVINDRLISGQLDETDLTLKDLDGIRQAFVSVMKGIYHPRVQYPERVLRRAGHAAKTSA